MGFAMTVQVADTKLHRRSLAPCVIRYYHLVEIHDIGADKGTSLKDVGKGGQDIRVSSTCRM